MLLVVWLGHMLAQAFRWCADLTFDLLLLQKGTRKGSRGHGPFLVVHDEVKVMEPTHRPLAKNLTDASAIGLMLGGSFWLLTTTTECSIDPLAREASGRCSSVHLRDHILLSSRHDAPMTVSIRSWQVQCGRGHLWGTGALHDHVPFDVFLALDLINVPQARSIRT